MSVKHGSVCIPPDAAATASHSKRLLTEDGQSRKFVKHAKEIPPVIDSPQVPRVHKNGNRIGVNQRMRIMHKYVVGKSKIDIAREEDIDRETVRRIVKCPEVAAYVEEKREVWRGLCDEALETIRHLLRANA
jgi:hypothetical protein